MKHIVSVTRLQMNKPVVTFGAPLFVILTVGLISALIVLALQRAGADPLSDDYIQGARMNAGLMWSLPGFLVYFGVQAVSTTFPLGMVLGATRRSFVWGTALANLVQSLYIALVGVILLMIEKATDHWGAGIYVFDVVMLGNGEPWKFALTLFLGSFTLLSIGGLFGAVWVRFGAKGPLILGLALGLILAGTIVMVAPVIGEVIQWITPGSVAAGASVAAVLIVLATWVAMRRASVRC